MQIEADGIIALMENKKQKEIAKMTFTSGTLNGKELVVVVCGVGKVNAAMCSFAMIQNYKPDCIINSGVAGSVSEKVSVGDIVVAVNVVEHDMNTTALGDLQGEVSFPESKVMYFNCDEKIADKLFASANKLENTRAEKGTIASGDIFISERRKRIVGEFSCKGFDTFGPFKLIGGISKGHPDKNDLDNAKAFFKELEKGK